MTGPDLPAAAPAPAWPAVDEDPAPGSTPILDAAPTVAGRHVEADAVSQQAHAHVDAVVARALARGNVGVDVEQIAREFRRRPWDYDTAAVDGFLAHADTLCAAADNTAPDSTVDGHSPEVLRAAASTFTTIAETIARDGGFTLPAPPAHPTNPRHAAEPASAAASEERTEDAIAEHTLLATMIHSPIAIEEISKVVLPGDFTTRRLGAVFTAVQDLAARGGLLDCTTAVSDTERAAAAESNYRAVLTELRAQRAHGMAIPGDTRLLAEITSTAPPHIGSAERLHAHHNQLRTARVVLEQSARRQIRDAGIHMRRVGRAALQPATDLRRPTERAEAILADLDDIAERLARSTGEATHTTPTPPPRLAPERHPLAAITAAFSTRAERDLIHLAMRGNAAALQFHPEDFGNRQNANTWRAIRDLHARGETINHITVHHACRNLPNAHRHTLNARQLERLHARPIPSTKRISHALRAVSHSAIHRATRQFRQHTRTLSTDRTALAEAQVAAVREHQTALITATRRLENITTRAPRSRP